MIEKTNPKIVKNLENKMTLIDAFEYILRHKRWRLPVQGEVEGEVHWVDEDSSNKKIDGCTLHMSSDGMCNVLVKNRVSLVPRINFAETGTVFYIDPADHTCWVALESAMSIRDIWVIIGSENIDDESISFFNCIHESMMDNDIVIFRERNK